MGEHNDLGRQTVLANLLQIPVHILGELAEEHTEEVGKQGPRKVKPLFPKVITVIEVSTL